MHLFDQALPFAASATLRHEEASVDDYLQLRARLGMTRCVIVQPSSYGTDHRALVTGLQTLGDSARGVAVVTPDAGDVDLETLAAHGVVGTRFNFVQRGVTDEAMVSAVAAMARRHGWHLQFHLLPADLLRLADEIMALPVPVVLDHFARLHSEPSLVQPMVDMLDRMLCTGKVWVKLSAPYLAASGDSIDAMLDTMAPLMSRHADRMVWGSDWPHATETTKPNDASSLDALDHYVGDAGQRQRIFTLNAAHLYRF